MKDLFKKVYTASFISSMMFLIFGILLIIQTESVIKTISLFIGTILLVIGIFPIVNYFRNRMHNLLSNAGLLYGIFSVVAGIIIIINSNLLATIIPVLTGVWMIVNSVNKIQLSMQLRDNNIGSWIISFIFAIIILICGSFLIINPLRVAFSISKMVGIIITIYALLDILDTIYIKIKSKEIKDQIIEVEINESRNSKKTSKEI
ncbi:MAG: DUF308 domain-containing protein [bacterium]|nr:DUF308 domain-containing protein [bacterium]